MRLKKYLLSINLYISRKEEKIRVHESSFPPLVERTHRARENKGKAKIAITSDVRTRAEQ